MSLPPLSNFPRLYNLLRSDPQANKEFNDYVSRIKSPVDAERRTKELTDSLESERILRNETQDTLRQVRAITQKSVRFIRLLGEVIEPQVNLTPYSQDVSMRTTYEIKFNATQIRMALKLYWDVLAENMENILMGDQVVDPVGESEEEG